MPTMTGPILVLDGGLGTTLEEKYQAKFSSATSPLWSSHLLISDPATLSSCQSAFAQAGADILLSATYQVSVEGFSRTKTPEHPDGLPRDKIPKYLQKAIEIGGGAKNDDGQLALSIGPYGATMVPSTEYSGIYDEDHDNEEKLLRWHKERFDLFRSPQDLTQRVDIVALETLPRTDEIRAVRKLGIGKKFWISVLYPNGKAMPDGTTPDDAVRAMLRPEQGSEVPWGVGVNCTKIQDIPSIVRSYEQAIAQMIENGEAREWPSLVLYPDGTNGGWYDAVAQTWKMPENPPDVPWEQQLLAVIKETGDRAPWRRIIAGGCCKVNDSDIEKLRACVSRN
ncbi:Homocysteine S-methyltransferase YbgG [Zalerion maritima]|uniref:Homocysteine S-methyltransferase YbgG n=1 Tax=Zalerion maritima TaxID=339359 RepID=A0AAD5RN59_9PEZI|nr:Homocysteine S-methyltransferase YbgG [Zalerion maritima]